MEIEEAIKQVNKTTHPDNYMLLTFGYDTKILLPYKDGMACLAALAKGELLYERYNEHTRIKPMENGLVKSSPFSAHDYVNIKVANLLNMDPKELLENK